LQNLQETSPTTDNSTASLLGERFHTTELMSSPSSIQQDDLSTGRMVAASDRAVVSKAQANEEKQRRINDDKKVEGGTDSEHLD